MPDRNALYEYAKETYAVLGVDVDRAIRRLASVPLSIHCWQGDDVSGFEDMGALTGGIAVTGNYPGKARTPEELMDDFSQVLRLVPGKKKLNLHASYAILEGEKVGRDALEPRHFAPWIDYAREKGIGLDFNPTFFSHPLSSDGFTLSNADAGIRGFWIDHAKACRAIANAMGEALGQVCVDNLWIPDGSKDQMVDKAGARMRLKEALDEIYSIPYDRAHTVDAMESKLFGIGAESFTVGSSEFYTGYATQNGLALTMDIGHYHPTEMVSDKISAVMCFCQNLLLHLSRPVRWDSDHVIILDDEVMAVMKELVRGDFLARTFIALDYFDASINRIAAWVIGARNAQKALLLALLEPVEALRRMERDGDYTGRLALLERVKTLPFGIVWDRYCAEQDIPGEDAWMDEVLRYQSEELSKRV